MDWSSSSHHPLAHPRTSHTFRIIGRHSLHLLSTHPHDETHPSVSRSPQLRSHGVQTAQPAHIILSGRWLTTVVATAPPTGTQNAPSHVVPTYTTHLLPPATTQSTQPLPTAFNGLPNQLTISSRHRQSTADKCHNQSSTVKFAPLTNQTEPSPPASTQPGEQRNETRVRCEQKSTGIGWGEQGREERAV